MRIQFFTLMLIPSLGIAAGPLNDTGTDNCRHPHTLVDTQVSATSSCLPAYGTQDARFGRDAAASQGKLAKTGGGGKGFDFIKVCNSGQLAGQGACPSNPTLGLTANEWGCTYDNHTGLMWEVKVADTTHYRSYRATYYWYEGGSGVEYGSAYGPEDGTSPPLNCPTPGTCDTQQFLALVNADQMCGRTGWRLPKAGELQGLVDYGSGTGSPATFVDPTYFPNSSTAYWTATKLPDNLQNVTYKGAYIVSTGAVVPNVWKTATNIRAVRTGKD